MAEEGVAEKKKRTRRCKEIIAVTEVIVPCPVTDGIAEVTGYTIVPGWPAGITRATKAIKEAKRMQTEWAKNPANAGKTLQDIILMRRLATVEGKSQVVMSFVVQ